MSVIECKDVDYVLAIAKHGSISKAAEELYVSQSALTKYLQHLEERLGIELFVRSKRPLVLTAVGETYCRYAQNIAQTKFNLDAELEHMKRKDYRLLRVGFACTGLRNHIFRAAQQMRASDHYGTQVALQELTSTEIEQKLNSHQLDIGFVTLPTRTDKLESALLLEENLLLAVPSSHRFASMGGSCFSEEFPVVNLDRFRSDLFVLRDIGTRFRDYSDILFSEASFTPEISAIARNNFSCVEFAEEWGICTITTRSFIQNLRNPDSMRFFVAGPRPQKFFVGLAYRKSKVLSPPENLFVEMVKASIATA